MPEKNKPGLLARLRGVFTIRPPKPESQDQKIARWRRDHGLIVIEVEGGFQIVGEPHVFTNFDELAGYVWREIESFAQMGP